MTENLAENLIRTALRHPAQAALRFDRTMINYAELEQASGRVAAGLIERGLEPGDRVGIMLPNVPQFAPAYYGVLRAGGVVVPMNVLLKDREIAYYLGDSSAGFVIAWHWSTSSPRARPERSSSGRSLLRPKCRPQRPSPKGPHH
jgi:long-chain acyl-CoA synthetase